MGAMPQYGRGYPAPREVDSSECLIYVGAQDQREFPDWGRVVGYGILHGQYREASTHSMIFARSRGAKERHNPVPLKFVDCHRTGEQHLS
jgi:hypothetical protein